MVRRLDLTTDGRLHHAEWIDPDTNAKHLFSARKPFRKTVVMADATRQS
jgi:hypothetical protein